MLALTAASASAELVEDAKFTIGKRNDGFRVAGSTDGLDLDGFKRVTFKLGSYAFSFGASEFSQTGALRRLTGGLARGISSFELDFQAKTYSITGKALALAPLPNPLAISLSADDATRCEAIRIKERKTNNAAGSTKGEAVYVLKQSVGGCVGSELPVASPDSILEGVPTDVRVAVPFAGTPLTLAQVFRVKPSGAVSGKPLCTLLEEQKDLYACSFSLTGVTQGQIALVVKATVDGKESQSESFAVQVVNRLDQAAAQKVIDLQRRAEAIWEDQRAAFGNTLKARIETIGLLRSRKGVRSAELSEDGEDIVIGHESGVWGALLLSKRFGTAEPAQVPRLDLGSTFATPKKRVFIWDPGFFAPNDEAPEIAAMMMAVRHGSDRRFARDFEVDYRQGSEATVDSLRSLTSYGTVFFSTHGVLGPHGQVALVSREPVTTEKVLQYRDDLQAGRLAIIGVNGAQYLLVLPGFISALSGSFRDTIVFSSSCHSSQNSTMSSAFLGKGAKGYLGFTKAVSVEFAYETAIQFMCGMVGERLDTGEAFGSVRPRVDGQSRGKDLAVVCTTCPVPRDADDDRARFTLDGSGSYRYPTDEPRTFRLKPTTIGGDGYTGYAIWWSTVPFDVTSPGGLRIPEEMAKPCFEFSSSTGGRGARSRVDVEWWVDVDYEVWQAGVGTDTLSVDISRRYTKDKVATLSATISIVPP